MILTETHTNYPRPRRSPVDQNALAALNRKTEEVEAESSAVQPTSGIDASQEESAAVSKDYIGIHCSVTLKSQLLSHATVDRVTLSQFVREVLQMELIRLSRQEVGSREQLMRERRAQWARARAAETTTQD
jgi:hypothetical protein